MTHEDASLLPGQLFHIGVVADDIDAAMAEMSRTLGLTWRGGRPASVELCIYGQERTVEMRIAHSVQGPPHVEVIQAVAGTPWETPAAAGAHHLCFWSDDAAAVCAALERAGSRRVLGRLGADSGYFLSPSGLYVEVIGRPLRDHLTAWIRGDLARR
jgi:catechol 2,3-dioxygenase-like lactoylglutathione lyase family enzyme